MAERYATTDFLVAKGDLRTTRVGARDLALAEGEALLRVDRFALTANNITYGAFGDEMGYWRFFPGDETWGRIPVWGFADVVESRAVGLDVGERVYGYLPMSTHLVVRPDKLSAAGFVDASPHRVELPPTYNRYDRWRGAAADERPTMLFRPLFVTSFLLDDFLASNDLFGAETVSLASASSKTALGLAYLLQARGVDVIGLTSPRNRAFVESTGYYDRVVDYENAGARPAHPTVHVDFAGDGAVRAAIHRGWGDRLVYDCIVGVTHWEDRGDQQALPGPRPEFFFAPTHLQRRLAEWGREPFEKRLAASFSAFTASAAGWLRWVEGSGAVDIERLYRDVMEARASPAEGHILSFGP